MNITPELDKLMWKIADMQDSGAAADFLRRFPHLEKELSGRLSAVAGIRKAKALYQAPPIRPAFTLSASRQRAFPWKAAGFASLVAGAALAAAVYFSLSPTSTIQKPYSPSTAPANTRDYKIVRDVEEPAYFRRNRSEQRKAKNSSPPPALPSTAPSDSPATPVVPISSATPTSLHVCLASVPLDVAVRSVAQQAHLQVQMAPNMPNATVSVDADKQSGIDILKDMGDRYGFSVLEEGESSVLLIPAKAKP